MLRDSIVGQLLALWLAVEPVAHRRPEHWMCPAGSSVGPSSRRMWALVTECRVQASERPSPSVQASLLSAHSVPRQ